MEVYLDFNATTPVDEEVQAEICSVLKTSWGNPSSSYSIGKEAKNVIERSRSAIADMIGASLEEVIFTSGGTESNNMVIQTVVHNYNINKNADNLDGEIPHIITTNIEHDSVKLPLEFLAEKGLASVTFVPVSKKTGAVNINDIIYEIRPNTRLITIMLANNETGVIQPVSLIKDYIKSLKRSSDKAIYLHTDAAQAIGKISVDVQELSVDYLTIVGHKFYGPRIGALYFRKYCPLHPLFYGGGQEHNYRPGTENSCMIAGLGKAAELVITNLKQYNIHMLSIRDYLEHQLESEFKGNLIFNNARFRSPRLPNTVSVVFNYDGITGKMILDCATGVAASTGAACHSGDKPSQILIASGISEESASKTLRLSVGRETTKEDIDVAIKCFKESICNLMNPNV